MEMAGLVAAPAALDSVYRKVHWRVLPFLLICYAFASLDKINVGFAKLQMQSDLGFSDAVYGLGAGIFFIGYVLFEVPSNLMLRRIGARTTVARVMILWGMVSTGMMFTHTATSFYLLRFFLGVFEAGFAPAMIYYLTYWYGPQRLAQTTAIVMVATPLAGILGGPTSAYVLEHLAGFAGLAGWQWMFVVEGLPCVLLGLLALRVLTDHPNDANWLTDDEKRLLAQAVEAHPVREHSFASVVRDVRTYLAAAAYFCIISSIYTVSFWLPSIIRANGIHDSMKIGIYSSLPYIAGAFGMFIFGHLSDRAQERRWHSAVPALLSALVFAWAVRITGNFGGSILLISLATGLIWAAYIVFWATPSAHLTGNAAAGGIALINTIGSLGGFVSPTVIGWLATTTGSMTTGLYLMAIVMLLAGVFLAVNPFASRPDA